MLELVICFGKRCCGNGYWELVLVNYSVGIGTGKGVDIVWGIGIGRWYLVLELVNDLIHSMGNWYWYWYCW